MELTIQIPDGQPGVGVTGIAHSNLKIIRETLGVNITARNGAVHISGDNNDVSKSAYVIEKLDQAAQKNTPLDKTKLLELIASAAKNNHHTWDDSEPDTSSNPRDANRHPPDRQVESPAPPSKNQDNLEVYIAGKNIKALTKGQQRYLESLQKCDLTFCSGPAGTGKTYLAVACAVAMLKRGKIRKLVLVRPAVEAGEKLGFLPGTMQDKVNPYLRPLLDALYDMMEFDQIQRFMACDLIEIVPLAFMRGRTLNDALIILDEAQNTTKSQMLMFLTRLGNSSKMIVTGDTSQIDLEDPTKSGLIDAVHRLRNTKGVSMVTLDGTDIVRHSLVQRIIKAYE